MKYIMPAFIISLSIVACNNHAAAPVNKSAAKDSIAEEQSFFPVPEYIGGQLKIIDSLQLPVTKTVKKGAAAEQHIASSMDELRGLAKNFQQPDISDSAIKKFYTETNIADQSVPSVTLIYAASNSALTVQKINVFIKPDPEVNDKVTGIYMEKSFTKNDTTINQKLYWKTGKNMQINTEKQINGKTLPVEQVKIIWDF